MTTRVFNSIRLITIRANDSVIDDQIFDGTLNAVEDVSTDARHFEDVWTRGERYEIWVNGTLVTENENIDG